MDLDDLTRKPWERQRSETSRNFHNFQHFMTLEPWRRSMRQAYTDHQVRCLGKAPLKNLHVPPDWQALRFKFGWPERAQAHDADVASRDRLRKIADAEMMSARHIALSVSVQNLCVQRLQEIAATGAVFSMSPMQLVRVLATAADVERRARGLPTEIVKHQTESAGGEMLDLSALTADELRIFETLLARCQPKPGAAIGPDGRT